MGIKRERAEECEGFASSKLRSRSCYRSTPKRRVIIDWQEAQTNNVIRNVGNLPGITGEHESSTG